MEKGSVRNLAQMLKWLVIIVFVVNMFCLLLVPGITAYVSDGGPAALSRALREELEMWLGYGDEHFPMGYVFVCAWWAVWTRLDTALLTLFYWLCGSCTAVILWQARGVLNTILGETPFRQSNARALKRAALACWVISGAALVRQILWLWTEGGIAPLFTYNALFIPAFGMAGLLFLVMSALFRQAAELKEDQDLTI